METRVIITTPKDFEGCERSYSTEQYVGLRILSNLPKEWKVSISWYQMLMSDVQWKIDKDNKIVEIFYNQNLYRWSDELIKAIKKEI